MKDSTRERLRAMHERVEQARGERRRLGSVAVAVSENSRLDSLLLAHVVEIERALVPVLEAAVKPEDRS